MQLHIIFIERGERYGSQKEKEERKKEEEGIRPTRLSDPHLLGPRSSYSQSRTHHQTSLNGCTQ